MPRIGRIIVNTGEGKGKTTAALGLALRAAGHGQRVGVVQFLKGRWTTGEFRALAHLPNVTLVRTGGGFTWQQEDPEESRRQAQQAWMISREMAESGEYDLLILDELAYALDYGLLDVDEVCSFLKSKPRRLSLVITGRNAPPKLVELADTVTDMRVVKHPYEHGRRAMKGIEY